MRTLNECTKWINQSASTIEEARFCTKQITNDIDRQQLDINLSNAIQSLIKAQSIINKQINNS